MFYWITHSEWTYRLCLWEIINPNKFFSWKIVWRLLLHYYIDVIMTTRASQTTSLTVVYSTVYSDADQSKHQSSASLAFVWGIHRDRWIPRTKGQLRGKRFHLMTSSCCIDLCSYSNGFHTDPTAIAYNGITHHLNAFVVPRNSFALPGTITVWILRPKVFSGYFGNFNSYWCFTQSIFIKWLEHIF